jgi:virginiamycin B lyase
LKQNSLRGLGNRKAVLAIAVMALLAVSGVAFYELALSGPCAPLGSNGVTRSQLQRGGFGSVTEYLLPEPSRWSNALAVAPDGSVWFGEQAYPGVGHLYPNGTLLEYPWPGSAALGNSSQYVAGIWGVALWNGMVWGADLDQSKLVGLNPAKECAVTINLPTEAADPYTLAVSPDGSLWFTSLSGSHVIGRVSQGLSVSIINASLPKGEIPAQIQFVNSTVAYFVSIDPETNSGGVYTFNPQNVSETITPRAVGTGYRLVSPNSLSVSNGVVWVVQHYPSVMASYDLETSAWVFYPTSTENYTTTTLPYFVQANGSKIWFNEHYGNKIAVIDTSKGTLTEYSEANPPVENGTDIQNDLTIAMAREGLWFTSTTGNYIGYVDATQSPGFSIGSENRSASAALAPGQKLTLAFEVQGRWSKPLSLQASDTENFSGVPKLISFAFSPSTLPAGAGPVTLFVEVGANGALQPGEYTLAVTATDGLVYQSAYVFLDIK